MIVHTGRDQYVPVHEEEIQTWAMQTKCWTLILAKARHVLQPNALDCCILIHYLFLGYFCQSIHPLDVEIGSINWSIILVNPIASTTLQEMYVYSNSIHGSQYTNTLELNNLLVGRHSRQSNGINQSTKHSVMSHCRKSINSFDIFFFFQLQHNFKALCVTNRCFFEYRMAELW